MIPPRTLSCGAGALWQEFFDEQSTSFYYFNPATGETQWTIDFADLGALPEEPRGAASAAESSPAEAEAEAAGLGQCETGAEHPECSADYAEQQPQVSVHCRGGGSEIWQLLTASAVVAGPVERVRRRERA